MDHMDAWLERLAEETEGLGRWKALSRADEQVRADPRYRTEELWWHARYAFADKKNTRTQDKFIWLLVYFSNWVRSGLSKHTELQDLYKSVFESPEMQAALADTDRLYDSFYEAVEVYVETLRQGRPLLGLIPVGGKDKKSVNRRVSREVAGQLLAPLGVFCRDYPHIETVLAAIFRATRDAYPGIQPALYDAIEEIENQEGRSYILSCVRDTALGD